MRLFLILAIFGASAAFSMTLEEKMQSARLRADISSGLVDGRSEAAADASAAPAAKPPAASEASAAPKGGSLSSERAPKYVVDDSDFIGGHYIGKVGESEADKKQVRESLRLAEKLLKENNGLVFGESKMFFVAAKDDRDAVSQLRYAAAAFEHALFGLFPEGAFAQQSMPKIAVNAVAAGGESAKVFSDGKTVGVNVVFDENLSLEDFVYALTDAAFERWSIADGAKFNPPSWVRDAVAYFALEEIGLGVPSESARVAAENPYKSLSDIFNYPRSDFDARTRAAHAYWLFKALVKVADRPSLAAFVSVVSTQKLSPVETLAELAKMLGFSDGRDIDMWLGCVICSEMYARSGGVDSVEASRREILRLASVVFFEDDTRVCVPFDALFARPVPETVLRSKIDELKFAIPKTNAVFMNSALALGGVYECRLRGDRRAYDKALGEFLAEFARARSAASAVKRAIGK